MSRVNRTEFIRVEKTSNYTVIHNQFLKRKDLSWKAKGILTYILSLPNDWNINIDEVMRHATEGRSAFRSGWKELKDAGYVKRQPVKDKNTKKILYWETVVRETVDISTKKPHVENPPSGNPSDGKSNTTKYLKELSTNRQSTDKDIVEQSSQSDKSDDAPQIPYEEIVGYLNEKAARQYRHTTKKTQSLIKARWNEGFRVDDFKRVIDNKISDWLNDTKMSDYLRPETLFGTKFEGYLNQKATDTKNSLNDDIWEV